MLDVQREGFTYSAGGSTKGVSTPPSVILAICTASWTCPMSPDILAFGYWKFLFGVLGVNTVAKTSFGRGHQMTSLVAGIGQEVHHMPEIPAVLEC